MYLLILRVSDPVNAALAAGPAGFTRG